MSHASHSHRISHRHHDTRTLRVGIYLAAAFVLALMVFAPRAEAATDRPPSAKQCKAYGELHHYTTGRPAGPARKACMHKAWLDTGLFLPFELNLIRACESGKRSGGRGIPGTFSYTAANRSSTASGAFQYLDSTWRSGAAGREKAYRRAKDAPRRVQDTRALRNWRVSNTPWAESKDCWS